MSTQDLLVLLRPACCWLRGGATPRGAPARVALLTVRKCLVRSELRRPVRSENVVVVSHSVRREGG